MSLEEKPQKPLSFEGSERGKKQLRWRKININMDGEERIAQCPELSMAVKTGTPTQLCTMTPITINSEADLLGLAAVDLLGLDEIRHNPAANQHHKQDTDQAMIQVTSVELESKLNGGEPKTYRAPRKHSPMSRLLPGSANPRGNLSRPRTQGRSGEKIYKGRMNLTSQQRPQQQQQQHQDQQQQRRQSQPRKNDNTKQQPPNTGQSNVFGAAPWATIRRKSRDGAETIRRRLNSSRSNIHSERAESRSRQPQRDSNEQKAEVEQIRHERRRAQQHKKELERLEQRRHQKQLHLHSKERRNSATSAMIAISVDQTRLLEEEYSKQDANVDDSTYHMGGKESEHRTENPEKNNQIMDGIGGNDNGHDNDTNVTEQVNSEKISMKETLAKIQRFSEGLTIGDEIYPVVASSEHLTIGEESCNGLARPKCLSSRLPGNKRLSLDSSIKIAEATEALLHPLDSKVLRRSSSSDKFERLSSCDTLERLDKLSLLFKSQRAEGGGTKQADEDVMRNWKPKRLVVAEDNGPIKRNSSTNMMDMLEKMDVKKDSESGAMKTVVGRVERQNSMNEMDLLDKMDTKRDSGSDAVKNVVLRITRTDSHEMDMLDKMDLKRNSESDAVKKVEGRFNRHSPAGKTIDSTREKGQRKTEVAVPGVSEKKRRQSAIHQRESKSDDLSGQKNGRRLSAPIIQMNKQGPRPVAKEKQNRSPLKLNISEHRAQSEDEVSSKKKALSRKSSDHRAQSKCEDEESSKNKDRSQQRGAQAASENSSNRSETRRRQSSKSDSAGMDDQSDKSGRKNKNTGFSSGWFGISPLTICTMCLCYTLSLVLCVGLGFFLHMTFFSEMTPSSGNQSYYTPESGREREHISTGPSHRPSHDPNQNTTSNDATLATKLSPSTMAPSLLPSTRPSSTPPSSTPSSDPTPTPSLSNRPTLHLTDSPSSSPTGIPGCPDTLLNWVTFDEDKLTLKYEVVVYQGAMSLELGGGLLCVSLEYEGPAGWIGLAFSEASRDPQFGLKEAIIGIPGLPNSVAVAEDGSASLGQQSNVALEDGPAFINPAKYLIPAGGTGKDGYSGPSLNLLVNVDKQTLVNGSVSIVEGQQSGGGIISDQDQNSMPKTRLSFVKYLRELNEIEIDPYGSTLLLYVVALLDVDGEYDGNPEWQSTTLTLLTNTSDVKGYVRKRTRQHQEITNN